MNAEQARAVVLAELQKRRPDMPETIKDDVAQYVVGKGGLEQDVYIKRVKEMYPDAEPTASKENSSE